MTPHRLRWLLVAMLVLIALRWWVPPRNGRGEPAVVAAVTRNALPNSPSSMSNEPARYTASVLPRAAPLDLAGNAFAVRVVRQVPPPPAPAPIKIKAFMGPPPPPPVVPPPPPPPPPLQVIGTWDDSQSPGVFIASSQGTMLARVGTVLLAEYRVTAVTPQQITLMHLSSKYEWRLPVPRTAAKP